MFKILNSSHVRTEKTERNKWTAFSIKGQIEKQERWNGKTREFKGYQIEKQERWKGKSLYYFYNQIYCKLIGVIGKMKQSCRCFYGVGSEMQFLYEYARTIASSKDIISVANMSYYMYCSYCIACVTVHAAWTQSLGLESFTVSIKLSRSINILLIPQNKVELPAILIVSKDEDRSQLVYP